MARIIDIHIEQISEAELKVLLRQIDLAMGTLELDYTMGVSPEVENDADSPDNACTPEGNPIPLIEEMKQLEQASATDYLDFERQLEVEDGEDEAVEGV